MGSGSSSTQTRYKNLPEHMCQAENEIVTEMDTQLRHVKKLIQFISELAIITEFCDQQVNVSWVQLTNKLTTILTDAARAPAAAAGVAPGAVAMDC